MITENDVLEWLHVCFDPELPVNIVDLGLVTGISVERDENAPGVEPRYRLSVTLTMRAPNDEREAMLLAQVSNRLAGIPAISRSNVTMSFATPWTEERMSSAAKLQLRSIAAAKSQLVQIQIAEP